MGNDTTNDAVAEEAAENFTRYAETMGGRVRLNWDERVEMSTNAHHVLFSEFLSVSGLFDRFVEASPLVYTSNNAPAKRDVLGTAVLGIVDGAKRWNVFTRLGEDGSHREATTSRLLLQRCVASIGTHAREKVVTLYVRGKDRTHEVFKDIAGFLGRVASASQLKPEARWMVIVRYAFRLFSFEKHEFPPWIDDQYMLNL